MADVENGTQFSNLPSCLVIDILLRLPIKTLMICRYVRKDWTHLYFSDEDFIRRHLQTSKIQCLNRKLVKGKKLRSECFVDEVRTENLRIETLDLSCKFLDVPRYKWCVVNSVPMRNWCVVNSCNGLVCLIDADYGPSSLRFDPSSSIYVCNPILGELVSIPYPKRDCFYSLQSALGFNAKNNEYKILLCTTDFEDDIKIYEWKIYTLGTRRGWRSIETEENLKPWDDRGLDFNTFIHGSLHWTSYSYTEGATVLQSFNFETERFSVLSLPEVRSYYGMCVTLGVINGCLWASFYDRYQNANGEMWAMKEYGVDKPWTMMLNMRDSYRNRRYDITDEELRARHNELVIYKNEYISHHQLIFTLNGGEMLLAWHYLSSFACYSIKRKRPSVVRCRPSGADFDWCGIAYNPSFVSLGDVAKEEQEAIS